MAADDVASGVGRIAVGAPLNGLVEVAGPEQIRLDEFIRCGSGARHDPRQVIGDLDAPHVGAELVERTLTPGDDAELGATRFENWLTRYVAAKEMATPCALRHQQAKGTRPYRTLITRPKGNTEMNTKNNGQPSEQQPDRQLLFLEELDDIANIAGDVVEIDAHTWAIHGSIPVDGDVIMAEYDTLDQARDVLNYLLGAEQGPPTVDCSNRPGPQRTPERRLGDR
jgi:hypothetical protein